MRPQRAAGLMVLRRRGRRPCFGPAQTDQDSQDLAPGRKRALVLALVALHGRHELAFVVAVVAVLVTPAGWMRHAAPDKTARGLCIPPGVPQRTPPATVTAA